jgi:hypothetical protein
MIQPSVVVTDVKFPLYKEIEIDFDKNALVYKNGFPSIITGKYAVLQWALKALRTQRFRYEIYSWNYGSEIESLIGQTYTPELKKAEAIRYISECLLVNPYITDVTDINIDFSKELLFIQCKIITVYGEVNVSV